MQLVLTSAWGFARDSLVYLKPRMPVSLSTPRYPGFSEGPWQIQPPKFWTNCPTEKWDGGFEGQMDAVTDHTGGCQSHSWVQAGSPCEDWEWGGGQVRVPFLFPQEAGFSIDW